MSTQKGPIVRIIVAFAILVVAAVVVLLLSRQRQHRESVGIIEPLQHVAVTDISRGVKDGLAEYANKVDILIENANRDNAQLSQIVAKYRDLGVAVYVPIFTGTAQTVKAQVSDKPIVFAAVTDPVGAELVKDPSAPEGNITGVSDLWPIQANLELVKKILPGAKTIGVVFDPGDPSSAVTMPELERTSATLRLTLVKRPISGSTDVLQALSSLKGRVDAIFTANDVTVTAVFPALVTFSIQNRIPLFAGDYSSVKRGAIGAVGQNYYNVGVEAGKLVAALLSGKAIRELPVQYTTGGDIYLNKFAATQMGVEVPAEVLQGAKETYDAISEN